MTGSAPLSDAGSVPSGDLLARRAERSPDVTGLVDAATGDRWSYADLDAAVDRTAGRLAGVGVGAGDHLGVLLETRPAAIRLAFAAARMGATLVPLNPRLTPAELGSAVERTDLDRLVCGEATEAAAVASAPADLPVASVDDPTEGADHLDAESEGSAAFEAAGLDPGDTQLLLFTSGTTGTPKLVPLTRHNLRASAVASAFRLGIDPDERWYSPLSTCHVGGLAPALRSTLYGTTAVIARSFDAATALDHLREYGCTAASLVPTMLRRMLDTAAEDGAAGGSLTALRFVLLGGAPASTALLDRCAAAGVPACPTYGLTEAASQVATARPGEAFEHPKTVGRPLLDTEVAVLDDEGEPCPPGEPGEIVVSGPTVTPGYYGDPAAAAAFGEHGFHTGDVGYREDGRLWVLNRRDDRIVTGGENVDPGEVAAALREHPRVRDAAVAGIDDPEWGKRVAALVVPDGGASAASDTSGARTDADALDADTLREHCRGRLAGFKRPRTVAFADALPRTASGTVDRETVRERLRAARDGNGE